MSGSTNDHPLSEEAFIDKARLFVAEMNAQPAESWQQRLWAALSLEVIARAALAHVSPVLLVPAQKWENLLYALGKSDTPVGPPAIRTAQVLERLQKLIPNLGSDTLSFCESLTHWRNLTLHSASLGPEMQHRGEWLPRFYLSCRMLLESMGHQISDVFQNPESIEQAIQSLQDATTQSVQNDINEHRERWSEKTESEQMKLRSKSTEWAAPSVGHVVDCPACQARSLVKGDKIAPVRIEVTEDHIISRQTMLPSSFECIACGLKISGYSRLLACDLGSQFTMTVEFPVAQYFGLYDEDEARDLVYRELAEDAAYEPNYNE